MVLKPVEMVYHLSKGRSMFGLERDILLTLIRHASAHQPEHRPSFAHMVDHLDRFEKQKRGN